MVAKIDLVGEEELRSTRVRHFEVELNRDQAKAKLAPEMAAVAGSGVSPVQIWIDAQGRLRKLQTKAPSWGQNAPMGALNYRLSAAVELRS